MYHAESPPVLQARLDGLIGNSSGLIETLPRPVQKRIQYLRNLQEEYNDREREYEKELDELDQKYEKIYGETCSIALCRCAF